MGSLKTSPRNVSRTVARGIILASGYGGDDGEVVVLLQPRLQAGAEPDVLVVAIDVDELAQLPLVVVETLAEARILVVEGAQRRRDVAGVDLDHWRPPGQLAQGPRNPDLDRHGADNYREERSARPSPKDGCSLGPTPKRPPLAAAAAPAC